jgi:glycosyltransferase involved in cell wall biosynthesis
MINPLISIVIPTYNRLEILIDCINSVRDQSYEHWECIVADDHSTDGTRDYITTISNLDQRIRYVRNQFSKGAQGARNTAIQNARGLYIAFLDSDNTFHKRKLEIYVDILSRHPSVDALSSYTTVVNSMKQPVGNFTWTVVGKCHEQILKLEAYSDFSQTMVFRERLLQIGMLDELCPSFQEWETHIRLSRVCEYYTVPSMLNCYLDDDSHGSTFKGLRKEILGQYYILNKHRHLYRKAALYTTYCRMVLRNCKKSFGLRGTDKLLALKFILLLVKWMR